MADAHTGGLSRLLTADQWLFLKDKNSVGKGSRTLLLLIFIALLPLYIYVGNKADDPARSEITRQTREVATKPTPALEPTNPPQPTPTITPQPTVAIEPALVSDVLISTSGNIPALVPTVQVQPTQVPAQAIEQSQSSSEQPPAPAQPDPVQQEPIQPEPVIGVVVSEHLDIDWYCRDTYGNYHAVYTGEFWACSDYQTTVQADLNAVANHNVSAYGLWVENAPGYCATNLRGGDEGWGIITCWP